MDKLKAFAQLLIAFLKTFPLYIADECTYRTDNLKVVNGHEPPSPLPGKIYLMTIFKTMTLHPLLFFEATIYSRNGHHDVNVFVIVTQIQMTSLNMSQ